ncbi:phosphatidylcholine:ceramide cholinephosphotransferase 2 [Neoarius graeffei]|uniref:phosphatidylcholine:ceramide cholinephosphotransferase 2 n=1 Tax=Neoarius graeffei TaxID=443677 RepID=UPI00298CE1D6|nr:phosphatidylcholine:ceramide cholinephosphotransferase 2 [Neoarius graeffei]XP_060793802.1 phosphatidylcholine:ceramide cholinephosphotransferase 2 [Neoarius graeffei]XP_060793803.1 phosphatidylcholine:ceramide cholinephosphotransferase 2 [Neoarius graeffei]
MMAVTELPESLQQEGENVDHIEVLVPDTPPNPQTPSTELTPAITTDGGAADHTTDNATPKSRLSRGFAHLLRKNQDYIRISMVETRLQHLHVDRLPAEWWKTGVSFLWAGIMLFCTTVMITVVHERVPEKAENPPLPDKFFDYVPRVEWAFTVTEVNGIVLTIVWTTQWLFLKHKSIIGRRFFFLMGMLYLYRIITMYITTLPVPSTHMNCAPKLYGDSVGKVYRVFQLVSGGGLSITGSHMMCGDFLYSGHTVILTLTYLFISEYSPRWMWWYHLICWLLSLVGVVFILVAHEHYSVDVVVAYFVTSRLFYWYHTMANNQSLRDSPQNYLSHVWWRWCFSFLERNVRSVVPCKFCWPFTLPTSCLTTPCDSYSKVQPTRDE